MLTQSLQGDEVLHLPGIVEAAAASPAAAAAAARQIRKVLSRGSVQPLYAHYNAIMLIRILADHPGQTFTKCFDEKFVSVIEIVLKRERDLTVQQIMRHTLMAFEQEKGHDRNLDALLRMWRKETQSPSQSHTRHRFDSLSQQQLPRHKRTTQQQDSQLPPPAQLVLRVEEARSTAKLLIQLLQTTPAAELSSSELVQEFAQRCQSANRSIQTFMHSTNPLPDEATMLTLIETSEDLNLATSQHQRTLLAARWDATAPRLATVPIANGGQSSNLAGPVRRSAAVVEPTPFRPASVAATTSFARSGPSQISDPFSDDYRVDKLLPNSRHQQPTAWSAFDVEISNSQTTFTQDQHSSELSNSYPSTRPMSAAHESHTEAVNGAPLASGSIPARIQNLSQHARPTPTVLPYHQHLAERHEMQSTPSYMGRQSDAVNFHVMSGAASSSQPEQRHTHGGWTPTTPSDHPETGWDDSSVLPFTGSGRTYRGKERIKDDSPIPELESSSVEFGWRHRA